MATSSVKATASSGAMIHSQFKLFWYNEAPLPSSTVPDVSVKVCDPVHCGSAASVELVHDMANPGPVVDSSDTKTMKTLPRLDRTVEREINQLGAICVRALEDNHIVEPLLRFKLREDKLDRLSARRFDGPDAFQVVCVRPGAAAILQRPRRFRESHRAAAGSVGDRIGLGFCNPGCCKAPERDCVIGGEHNTHHPGR
eukprot:3934186-Rhodomonas_salina.1